jgi:hypothetical protein
MLMLLLLLDQNAETAKREVGVKAGASTVCETTGPPWADVSANIPASRGARHARLQLKVG